MPSAEIITIGTEILLGEITDTNARYIARSLRDAGIDLYRKMTVGDNVQRISQAIRQALERSDIVITTGGLGPTVDDPTREAVALALGVEIEYRPELWEQIEARFRRYNRPPTENNKRQAFIPTGAIPVENPVGTAPAFIIEIGGRCLAALPGVPREMEYLLEQAILPYLRRRYKLSGIIKARLLHTAGVGESQIDSLIDDLERLSNPTVGLAAHSGQVDVRIAVKAASEAEADELMDGVEVELRKRLGGWIYGADEETLETAALAALQSKGWTLAVVEAGLGGDLVRRLAQPGGPLRGGEVLAEPLPPDNLHAFTASFRQSHAADVGLGVAVYRGLENLDVCLILITPEGSHQVSRPFGGPPEYVYRWAINHSLDTIRNL